MTKGNASTLEYGHNCRSNRVLRFLAKPPGRIFFILALGLAAATLYADSFPGVSFNVMVYVFFAWAALSILWVIRVVLCFSACQPIRLWRRSIAPLLALVTIGLMCFDVPFQVRFAVSRQALTSLALQEIAKATSNSPPKGVRLPMRAGAFTVIASNVDKSGQTDFDVRGSDFGGSGGLTYSPHAVPTNHKGPYWEFESLGNGWYRSYSKW